jgi:hypothetical protein
VKQAARPGADDEQCVPRPQPDAILRSQRAGERLGAGRDHRIQSVEREQLVDELGLDPDVLGEAAGVQAGRAELRAERLVSGEAGTARPAGGVVVDRDGIARSHALDAARARSAACVARTSRGRPSRMWRRRARDRRPRPAHKPGRESLL